MKTTEIKQALAAVADPQKAAFYPRFFKTGKGEYGEGDRFVGVVVPEHRLTGLLILTEKVQRGDEETAEEIYHFTLKHVDRINNWDLVDQAAPRLIGPRLAGKPQRLKMLERYAASEDLWKRRIAMLSTLPFIKRGDFSLTLKLADRLLEDEHDLIHKAVGWMLREIGNRDVKRLKVYLDGNAARMPRTMLRYAIEKLPQTQRKRYLKAGS